MMCDTCTELFPKDSRLVDKAMKVLKYGTVNKQVMVQEDNAVLAKPPVQIRCLHKGRRNAPPLLLIFICFLLCPDVRLTLQRQGQNKYL